RGSRGQHAARCEGAARSCRCDVRQQSRHADRCGRRQRPADRLVRLRLTAAERLGLGRACTRGRRHHGRGRRRARPPVPPRTGGPVPRPAARHVQVRVQRAVRHGGRGGPHPVSRGDNDAAGARELPRELLPLAPFLYLAWSDGSLDDEELAAIRDAAARSDLLDGRARDALHRWLEPAQPPSAAELAWLLDQIQEFGSIEDASDDLARLGERIAARTRPGSATGVAAALSDIQRALGVAPAEAARALAGTAPAEAPAAPPRADFDPRVLNAYLDADRKDTRADVLNVLTGERFRFVDRRDTAAYRETVLEWCRILARRGFGALAYPAEFGGRNDVAASIAAVETLAFHDTKIGRAHV